MIRSRPMRWVAPLVLLSLVGVACGSDDDERSSVCGQFEQKLRSCELLSPGTFDCEEPDDESEQCEARCLLDANCTQIQSFFCDALSSDPVALCMQSCGPAMFQCRDGVTLPGYVKCDGVGDCADASDEFNCPVFVCNDGVQLPESYRCDGYSDCADASDELGCDGGPMFTCRNGTTVPESWQCDGEPDCSDGSDELGCPEEAEIICD